MKFTEIRNMVENNPPGKFRPKMILSRPDGLQLHICQQVATLAREI